MILPFAVPGRSETCENSVVTSETAHILSAHYPYDCMMSNPSAELISAILEDDQPRAKKSLKRYPHLSIATMEAARYIPEITHWIYAGDTALHVAAAGYRVEISKSLLNAGADPMAAKNHRLGQPLHYACDGHFESLSWEPQRQIAMIQLLVDAGGDIHAQDKNGATPLHRAVRTRCAAAVKCLLRLGADATIFNKSGSTPFHLAVQNTGRGGSGAEKAKSAQREIIAAFLQIGVSVDLEDRDGRTVLEWAKSQAIRQLLITKFSTDK